jgi:hypothetical protein
MILLMSTFQEPGNTGLSHHTWFPCLSFSTGNWTRGPCTC